MSLFRRRKDWLAAQAEVLETVVLETYLNPDRPTTHSGFNVKESSVHSKKLQVRLSVTHPRRGIYQVTTEFKLPRKKALGRAVPVRIDPEDPRRIEICWDQVPSAAERTVERLSDGIGQMQQVASELRNQVQHSNLAAAAPLDPQEAMDQARQMLLENWRSAPASLRPMLEQQMRALGIEPPAE